MNGERQGSAVNDSNDKTEDAVDGGVGVSVAAVGEFSRLVEDDGVIVLGVVDTVRCE
jgi:hypothetical protein